MGFRKRHNTDFCHGRRFVETRVPAPPSLDAGRTWYLVVTMPRSEARVRDGLMEIGCSVWLPALRREVTARGRQTDYETPTFPGYLFVADLPFGERPVTLRGLPITAMRDVPGLLGVISTPRGFLRVPRAAFETVIRFQNEPEPPRPDFPFEQGARVTVLDGPFASFCGVVDEALGHDYVKVLVEIFGRSTPVQLEIGQIEAA